MTKCKSYHTHIRIGYIWDNRVSGMKTSELKLLGKIVQKLHITRLSEYDDHWIYEEENE